MIAVSFRLQNKEDYRANHNQGNNHSQGDFNPRPGPFPLNFACSGVDQKTVHLVLEPVGTDPYRQEDVFERDIVILRFF